MPGRSLPASLPQRPVSRECMRTDQRVGLSNGYLLDGDRGADRQAASSCLSMRQRYTRRHERTFVSLQMAKERCHERNRTRQRLRRALHASQRPAASGPQVSDVVPLVVGFVMLHDDPEAKEYFLWRLMIDSDHQGKGYARRALDLLVDYVRTRPGATELRSSYVEGDDGPAGFYRGYGFVETGEMEGTEVEIRLAL